MTAPYIPLYIDDLDAAIAHLSLIEEAVYMRLIKMAWRSINCTIPNDLDFVSRKIRADKKDIETILTEFFTLKNGKWSQKRLKLEFDKYKNKISERKKAGKIGGTNNALKNNNKKVDFAIAKSSKPEPEPEPDIIDKSIIKKETKKKSIPKTTFLESGIESLPDEWIDYARLAGFQNQDAERIFQKFKTHWTKNKPNERRPGWLASWQRWIDNQEKWGFKGDQNVSNKTPKPQEVDFNLLNRLLSKNDATTWKNDWFGFDYSKARQLIQDPKISEIASC